jgi:serine/threonine-protein kinase
LTQRSDVFSAGIVVWELLALRRLFPADQEKEPGEAVQRGGYPSVSQFRPDLPPELDAIVARALELDPELRFATMHELAVAVEAAAPARANARRIGEWVNELARDALAERNRMVARAENWVSGVEIPLKSAPFTAELPLRSSRPPPVAENASEERFPSAPPLPTSVSMALASSSAPPSAAPAPMSSGTAPATSSSRWWVWGLLLLAVAAYFALRAT